MNNENRVESISQVSPHPVEKGVERREKGKLQHNNTGGSFQLNSLGGPLEENFTEE